MSVPASTRTHGRTRPGTTVASTRPASRWTWRQAERAVLRAGRALIDDRLVVGTVGNVSTRLGDELRITPTRKPYETMRRSDLVRVDVPTGAPLARDARPSRELPLHLAVYRARPDVGAVIHTHSPCATAWSFLDQPLQPELEDLAYYGIGEIRTAAPAPPGTAELAHNVSRALGQSNAVLLGHHGVLTTGRTVEDALVAARVVEHQAKVAWLVRGGASLPTD